METTSVIRSFEQLSNIQLYQLLKLRSEVFVIEQNCIFLDADDKDQKCHHLLLYKGEALAAYSRIVPAGVSYAEVSIGRVVTSPAFRGTGLGRELMERSIQACVDLYGAQPVRIGAQYYAVKFYGSLGFVPQGEIYDEDGIDHIEMVLHPDKNII